MTLGRWSAGALALGVFATGTAAWLGHGGDASAPSAPPAAARTAPQPLPAPRPPAPRRQAAGVPADSTFAAQVERLLASGDPAQAFAAYRLISDCAEFNDRHDRLVFDPREAARAPHDTIMAGYRRMTDEEKRHDAVFCAGLTERQRQSRIDALALAAKAGVPGAAVAFATAGPFGDPSALESRPGDPLVQAWRAQATAQLQQAADSGDAGALFYLAPALQSGSAVIDRNPQLAYRYETALGLVYADKYGADNPFARAFTQDVPQMLEHDLDPAVRAEELARARRIAALEKARREGAARAAGTR